MLEQLKQEVLEANLSLPKYQLVTFTWGNVSAIDRQQNLIVIKPSGVSYEDMKKEDMTVIDFEGNIVDGALKPSSDMATHIELYKAFPHIGAVVHTHSPWATSWAQAGKPLPPLGTTHADYFRGSIPVTRPLSKVEIETDYEKNTGKVIIETFQDLNPTEIPSVLVHSHAPFNWAKDVKTAVHNAVVLEECAKMAFQAILLNPNLQEINPLLLEKHFDRKHGKNAYYGQKKGAVK